MDIKRIDNIGIAVTDIDRSVAFYREILDLPAETSEWGGQVTVGDQTLFIFATNAPATPVGRTIDTENNPVGIDHLAMEVEDIEAAGAELEGRGISFPGAIVGGAGEFRYRGFSDPDGNMLYIVQQPA